MKSISPPFHDYSAEVNLFEVSALKDGQLSPFDIQDPDVNVVNLQNLQQVFHRDARDRREGIYCRSVVH